MFHKVCKWCKNNWFGIAFFSFSVLFVVIVAAYIINVENNMSPEDEAEIYHKNLKNSCSYYLDDMATKAGVRNGVDLDTEECVLVTQVNLKTSGEDTPLIGEYRVNIHELRKNSNGRADGPMVKETEGKIQNLCYEGKPVHIVDGHTDGVYKKFPQDKDDSEYSEQQKQIRNARLLDTSCEPGSVQIRVWDGSDPGRAPYPIRVIPYYNK